MPKTTLKKFLAIIPTFLLLALTLSAANGQLLGIKWPQIAKTGEPINIRWSPVVEAPHVGYQLQVGALTVDLASTLTSYTVTPTQAGTVDIKLSSLQNGVLVLKDQ